MKEWFRNHKSFIKYLLISCFVTVVDIFLSRVGELLLFPAVFNKPTATVTANTIGVVAGFILQYILCANRVYQKKGTRIFIIFFGTFLGGLFLADGIIYFVRIILLKGNELLYVIHLISIQISLSFIIAKLASIIIPFFLMYFVRKKLIGQQ